MTSTIKNKAVFTIITTVILLLVCFNVSHAHITKGSQTVSKKDVGVDIGHAPMHCPVLNPKLEAKLREIKDIENFFIDKRVSYATFNLPMETKMTSEALKKIDTDERYPADDVVNTADSKPIKITINNRKQ